MGEGSSVMWSKRFERERGGGRGEGEERERGGVHLTLNENRANRVSGVLIGSTNTRRMRMQPYLILNMLILTLCSGFNFDLFGEQDSFHN